MKDLEKRFDINGVSARMTIQSVRSGALFLNQRIVTETRRINSGEYAGCNIRAELRFDDCCGNGHNSFSITGEIIDPKKRGDNAIVACGCIHEAIAEFFPELQHLIKWHLCSTDSPMHYVANTVYHAGDRDYNGKRKGEALTTESRLYFGDCPISFPVGKVLRKFLSEKANKDINDFELVITPVPHDGKGKSGYQFDDKYTLSGCDATTWTYAPFDSRAEAAEWVEAIKGGYHFKDIVTKVSEGKARDFDAARSCGVWPDATDEQLSVEPEELKAALIERLPALIEKMKSDITGAGFDWSAE